MWLRTGEADTEVAQRLLHAIVELGGQSSGRAQLASTVPSRRTAQIVWDDKAYDTQALAQPLAHERPQGVALLRDLGERPDFLSPWRALSLHQRGRAAHVVQGEEGVRDVS